jgi:chemotaxis protein MotB
MGRERKQAADDETPGAPQWMVTFSDCMTLLLTFFVLLLSFSSFDEHIFRTLERIFTRALPAVSKPEEKDKDAFLTTEQIEPTENPGKGSEKPTLASGEEDNLKEETEPMDFHSRKVFFVSSKKIFWGNGTAISLQGHRTLSTMASFLKEVPSRVVISENGGGDEKNDEQLGPSRAWSVIEYLITKGDLDKKRFSISIASMCPKDIERSERMVEIILLERSIYN